MCRHGAGGFPHEPWCNLGIENVDQEAGAAPCRRRASMLVPLICNMGATGPAPLTGGGNLGTELSAWHKSAQ